MTKFLTCLCLILTFNAPAYGSINLEWKLQPKEVLAYKTKMSPPKDSTQNFIKLNLDKLVSDGTPNKKVFDEISKLELPEDSEMTSVLKASINGNFSVLMILDSFTVPNANDAKSKKTQEKFNQLFEQLKGKVNLRGEISPSGSVESFYLEQNQKNLLAIMFELPQKPVDIGDTWSLDMNCISLGGTFKANSSSRVNQVQLSSIKNSGTDTIAVIDYLITETVEGSMHNPMNNNSSPLSMTCSYIGRHEFFVERGRWKSVIGQLAIQSSGFMKSDVQQIIAMSPIHNVPSRLSELD